jgi:hypothetical protein
MTTALPPNQPQQATAGQSRPQQAAATYPRPPGALAAAAAAKRRHVSRQYPAEVSFSIGVEQFNSLKRLTGRRGLKLNETTHLRHALDVYLNSQDPIFRAWLDGAPGK